jgi:hypothetical protein
LSIKTGDLLWDDLRKKFGIVVEETGHHDRRWIIYWNDNRRNWVDEYTALGWKLELKKIL